MKWFFPNNQCLLRFFSKEYGKLGKIGQTKPTQKPSIKIMAVSYNLFSYEQTDLFQHQFFSF